MGRSASNALEYIQDLASKSKNSSTTIATNNWMVVNRDVTLDGCQPNLCYVNLC